VPHGREPDHPHYAYKLEWLGALREVLARELGDDRPLAVCGDFNVAPTDADVWDPAEFAHATHVTPPERQALAALRALGLADVVPRPLKYDRPFTYWDYRAGMFHKNLGMRIDLVYANQPFATAVRDAYVDRDARKGKAPSDHAPVVVDVAVGDLVRLDGEALGVSVGEPAAALGTASPQPAGTPEGTAPPGRAPEFSPMLAEGGYGPFDDPGWRFEPKLDGVRTLAYVSPKATRLVSATGRDQSAQYPELGPSPSS
jgi:hypothetical protein